MGRNEDKGAMLFLVVPRDRTRGDEHKLKHVKTHPNPRKYLFLYACACSVYMLAYCVCLCCVCMLFVGVCVYVFCCECGVWLCARCMLCACYVCMCAYVVVLCVFSVCGVVVQGCVWPQPVLGSMGVPTGPKIRLSPRKAPDGARGMWERGLWGM